MITIEHLPLSVRKLGRACGLLLIAAAVAWAYPLPGHYLAERLSSTEIYVELADAGPPTPTVPVDLPGLTGVACSLSRMELASDINARGSRLVPGAVFYTCRLRFRQSHAELFGGERLVHDMLKTGRIPDATTRWLLARVEPTEASVDVQAVLRASLGPAMGPPETAAAMAWRSREVLFGSEALLRAVPSAATLLLVVLASCWLRLGLWADLRRTWAIRGAPVDMRLFALFIAPPILQLPFQAIRRWLGQDATPMLFSIGFPQLPSQSLIGDAFSTMVSAPVSEELVYRVWMIPLLSRGMNAHLAILSSSALFAHAHGHHFLPHLASGMAFGYLWHYGRSATLCIGAHVLSNANVVIQPLVRHLMSSG